MDEPKLQNTSKSKQTGKLKKPSSTLLPPKTKMKKGMVSGPIVADVPDHHEINRHQ